MAAWCCVGRTWGHGTERHTHRLSVMLHHTGRVVVAMHSLLSHVTIIVLRSTISTHQRLRLTSYALSEARLTTVVSMRGRVSMLLVLLRIAVHVEMGRVSASLKVVHVWGLLSVMRLLIAVAGMVMRSTVRVGTITSLLLTIEVLLTCTSLLARAILVGEGGLLHWRES